MTPRNRIGWIAAAVVSAANVGLWTPVYNRFGENPAIGLVVAIFAGFTARACFVLWRERKERYEVAA